MKVEIPDHSREELTKLRCFLTGYHHGKGEGVTSILPGELILRQLIMAIDASKETK
jgi:hypothetical protein